MDTHLCDRTKRSCAADWLRKLPIGPIPILLLPCSPPPLPPALTDGVAWEDVHHHLWLLHHIQVVARYTDQSAAANRVGAEEVL